MMEMPQNGCWKRRSWILMCSLFCLIMFDMTVVTSLQLTCKTGESHDEDPTSTDRKDMIHCSFSIPKFDVQQHDSPLKITDCIDDYCINAQVTLSTNTHAKQEDKEEASSDTKTSDSYPQSDRFHESDETIDFIDQFYSIPYPKYGRAVAQVLRDVPTRDFLDEISWLLQLSAAHREGITDSVKGSSNQDSVDHFDLSIQALKHAETIIAKARLDSTFSGDTLDAYQATVYFYYGETYSWPSTATDKGESQQHKASLLAIEYYTQAEKVYKNLLLAHDGENADNVADNNKGNGIAKDNTPGKDSLLSSFVNDVPWTKADLQSNWALCALRIGNHWLDEAQALSDLDSAIEDFFDSDQEYLESKNTDLAQDFLDKQTTQLTRRAQTAVTWLTKAKTIFSSLIFKELDDGDDVDDEMKANWYQHWGASLNSLQQAHAILKDYLSSLKCGIDAIDTFNESLRLDVLHSDEVQETRQTIASIYYNLADLSMTHLTYNEALKYYKQSMNYYQNYHLKIPPMPPVAPKIDAKIKELERALEKYSEQLTEGGSYKDSQRGPDEEFDNDDELIRFEKDDVLEGAWHFHLASFYADKGENILAASHYQLALPLYSELTGANRQLIAHVYLGMAELQFRQEQFVASAESYRLAVDIYREAVLGNDPLPISQEELEMLREELDFQDLDMLGQESLNLLIDTTNVQKRPVDRDDLSAKKVESQNVDLKTTENGSDEDDGTPIIDLDNYRTAVLNVSSPSIKEEL